MLRRSVEHLEDVDEGLAQIRSVLPCVEVEEVAESTSVPDIGVIGKQAEQDPGHQFPECVLVIVRCQEGVVKGGHVTGGYEVGLFFVLKLLVWVVVVSEPEEQIEVVGEVGKIEGAFVVGFQVLPCEVLEVAVDQEPRNLRGVQRRQVVDQLIHGHLKVFA